MKISVIVTNYNGQKLLKKFLPYVFENSTEADEIIVTDDASKDDSIKYLKNIQSKYPKLKIIHHIKNIGFAANTNFAVNKAIGDYIVLLNNDINPQKNYIKNSLNHFKDEKVFGIGFAEIGNENWARIYWKSGYIQYNQGKPSNKSHITGWLSGGSSIIKKEYFLKLGGFDTIYKPFYSEDVDLGYRAWKSGYKLIWQPKAQVFHQHESTISRFPKRFTDYVKERNRLLVVLRNITDPKLLLENKLAIFSRCLLGPNYLKIIRAAKKEIKKHPKAIVFPVLTDKEIFQKFK